MFLSQKKRFGEFSCQPNRFLLLKNFSLNTKVVKFFLKKKLLPAKCCGKLLVLEIDFFLSFINIYRFNQPKKKLFLFNQLKATNKILNKLNIPSSC